MDNHNLPSGTVTFLFTDIEGSTSLAQKYPGELPALLARHNAILRDAIESNHGHIFRIAGDAFCAAFPTPRDGFQAALTAQRGLQQEAWNPVPVLVRMGINTGEARLNKADLEADPYVGYLTLTRAQRVMSTAHGGQILLSHATAELVRGELSAEITLRDMGDHKLKGLLQPEKLWQVVAPDLRQEFAPLQTMNALPNNLPGTLNRFVGRAHELQEVKQRLSQTRLLTLLGPGGTGKTRLAIQAARELLPDFEDHVYFVDLAPCRDADAALAAIGRTIGIRESTDKPLLDELKGQIRDRKMLSLLDNFEQVTVAAGTMAELLRDCPELKMLVTSRETLHVRGENVFPVPPLGLPPTEVKHASVELLAQSEAVQLFLERAQAVKPNFELTNENAPAVAEICARLDGLPLAIELATARLNIFTPQALAERLGNRLKLLRGGARDLPARQQTLRDTIDWSYEILDAQEQSLFQLLAIFSGATFEAVEAVASRIHRFDDFDIFEGISSLADKSLIRQEESTGGQTRLRMLETIREFAMDHLKEDTAFNGEVCRAHATYFAEFTASQWQKLLGAGREDALAVLTVDLDNIRAAWRYWAAEGNLEQVGKFTDSLWALYDARGWYHATIELITELLAVLSATVSTPERAREEIILQTSLARALLASKGYTAEVEQAYARALELITSIGEMPQLFPVLRGLASFYVLRAEDAKGAQIGKRILELAERLDDVDMRVEGHLVSAENIGALYGVSTGLEHLEKALALYDPKRPRVRRLGLGSNPGVVSNVLSALYVWMLGFPERSRKHLDDAIALAQKLNHPFSTCYAFFHYGLLNFWMGNYQVAQDRARALMDLAAEYDFQIWTAVAACLRGAATVHLGAFEEGLAMIEPGIALYRELKTPPVFVPLLVLMQADALISMGRYADALPNVNQAIEMASANTNQVFTPDVLGLKGDLLLALDPANAPEAEGLFQFGLQVAQEQETPMFELRIVMRLSRLWQAQGKIAQARAQLQESYSKMTEGFDFPDLVRARELLDQLSGDSASQA